MISRNGDTSMISHRDKYIFVHIPKNAGMSIKAKLKDAHSWVIPTPTDGVDPKLDLFWNHHGVKDLADQYPQYFTFAFTRNPWDRFVSTFFYLKAGGMKKWDGPDVQKYIGNKSFREFTLNCDEAIENQTHFKRQHWWLNGPVDFIGRVENLQEDFDVVCDKIKIPRQKLPHANKSKHKHYTEYYDDETWGIVADKYKTDIERFGYES